MFTKWMILLPSLTSSFIALKIFLQLNTIKSKSCEQYYNIIVYSCCCNNIYLILLFHFWIHWVGSCCYFTYTLLRLLYNNTTQYVYHFRFHIYICIYIYIFVYIYIYLILKIVGCCCCCIVNILLLLLLLLYAQYTNP